MLALPHTHQFCSIVAVFAVRPHLGGKEAATPVARIHHDLEAQQWEQRVVLGRNSLRVTIYTIVRCRL